MSTGRWRSILQRNRTTRRLCKSCRRARLSYAPQVTELPAPKGRVRTAWTTPACLRSQSATRAIKSGGPRSFWHSAPRARSCGEGGDGESCRGIPRHRKLERLYGAHDAWRENVYESHTLDRHALPCQLLLPFHYAHQ